jgi:hypothetical protein
VGHELPECRRLTFPAKGSDNIVHLGQRFRGVGEKHEDWRFVRDEGPHPARVARHECETRNRPAAAAKHVGGFEPQCVQDRGNVVGPLLDRRILGRVVESAARNTARIVGDHRVVRGEGIGKWRERHGAHWRSHDQHCLSGPADLITQMGTRDFDSVGCGHGARSFSQAIITIVAAQCAVRS